MSHFSMVPMMFQDPWYRDYMLEFERPRRLLDQHFGMGITESDITRFPRYHDFYRHPGRQLFRQNTGSSQLSCEPEKFEVSLDVQQFTPSELSVKTVDRFVLVEGKHEEKRDEHGYISRQFTRKYLLPEGTEEEKVMSSLSRDGVLTITAPRKIFMADKPTERVVPIQTTGEASITQKPAPVATAVDEITEALQKTGTLETQ